MAVADGNPVDAATTNAAFVSRLVDSSMIGVLSLNNSGSASIADVQDKLNKALARESFSNQAVENNSFINISDDTVQYRRVSGDGSATTTNNQPFGATAANFVQGKTIELVGTDSTDTITIPYSDTQYGCLLKVGDCTLGKGDILVLIYDDVLERFLEVSRNF